MTRELAGIIRDGGVLALRFVERDGALVLQMLVKEQNAFYDTDDSVTPPEMYTEGLPVEQWRDVPLFRGETSED